MTSRREREREELRRLILTTARQIIAEEGYEALTIRKVATRIDYSPMALYNHFTDKAAILLALAQETFRELETMLPGAGRDPLETLRESMLVYIRFGLDHPHEYRVTFITLLPGRGEFDAPESTDTATNNSAGRSAFGRLVFCVRACQEAGLFGGDPFEVATALWAGIHGVVSLQITLTSFPFGSQKAFAQRVVDLMLSGLGSARETGTSGLTSTRARTRR